MVFVGPVLELLMLIPVERGTPLRHSNAKLLVAGTATTSTGATPFAGTVVELNT
jgi:hypothetical protein